MNSPNGRLGSARSEPEVPPTLPVVKSRRQKASYEVHKLCTLLQLASFQVPLLLDNKAKVVGQASFPLKYLLCLGTRSSLSEK